MHFITDTLLTSLKRFTRHTIEFSHLDFPIVLLLIHLPSLAKRKNPISQRIFFPCLQCPTCIPKDIFIWTKHWDLSRCQLCVDTTPFFVLQVRGLAALRNHQRYWQKQGLIWICGNVTLQSSVARFPLSHTVQIKTSTGRSN